MALEKQDEEEEETEEATNEDNTRTKKGKKNARKTRTKEIQKNTYGEGDVTRKRDNNSGNWKSKR